MFYDLAARIKDLESENLTNILKHSLTKGNVQPVTVSVNGKAEKMFIEANPVEKTVNIYDGQMKPLAKEQKQLDEGYLQTMGIRLVEGRNFFPVIAAHRGPGWPRTSGLRIFAYRTSVAGGWSPWQRQWLSQ